MAQLTRAQLADELAALRHNYEQLEAQLQRARAELEALRTPAPAPRSLGAALSALPKRSKTVFEFDPSVKGDFVRASQLARANNGIVRRCSH